MNATLAFNLRLISVIVWNTENSVIVYRLGWGDLSQMESTDDFGIFAGSGCVYDAVLRYFNF